MDASVLQSWLDRHAWNIGVDLTPSGATRVVESSHEAHSLGKFVGQLHTLSNNLEASCLFWRESEVLKGLEAAAGSLRDPARRRARRIVRKQLSRRECLVYSNARFPLVFGSALVLTGWEHCHFGGMPLDLALFLSTYPKYGSDFWQGYRQSAPRWSVDEQHLASGLAALLRNDKQMLLFDLSVEDYLNAVAKT